MAQSSAPRLTGLLNTCAQQKRAMIPKFFMSSHPETLKVITSGYKAQLHSVRQAQNAHFLRTMPKRSIGGIPLMQYIDDSHKGHTLEFRNQGTFGVQQKRISQAPAYAPVHISDPTLFVDQLYGPTIKCYFMTSGKSLEAYVRDLFTY